MNPKVCFVILILFSLYSDVYTSCACDRRAYSKLSQTCSGNFVGVVEVTGPSETCPDETKKCFDIQVLDSFNPDIEADSIKTIEADQACAPELNGKYILSGLVKENESSCFISGCVRNRVLEQIDDLEDPKVNEYREYARICRTKGSPRR